MVAPWRVDELAGLIAQHQSVDRLCPVTVLVPGHSLGLELRRFLGSTVGVVNVDFVTPADWVRRQIIDGIPRATPLHIQAMVIEALVDTGAPRGAAVLAEHVESVNKMAQQFELWRSNRAVASGDGSSGPAVTLPGGILGWVFGRVEAQMGVRYHDTLSLMTQGTARLEELANQAGVVLVHLPEVMSPSERVFCERYPCAASVPWTSPQPGAVSRVLSVSDEDASAAAVTHQLIDWHGEGRAWSDMMVVALGNTGWTTLHRHVHEAGIAHGGQPMRLRDTPAGIALRSFWSPAGAAGPASVPALREVIRCCQPWLTTSEGSGRVTVEHLDQVIQRSKISPAHPDWLALLVALQGGSVQRRDGVVTIEDLPHDGPDSDAVRLLGEAAHHMTVRFERWNDVGVQAQKFFDWLGGVVAPETASVLALHRDEVVSAVSAVEVFGDGGFAASGQTIRTRVLGQLDTTAGADATLAAVGDPDAVWIGSLMGSRGRAPRCVIVMGATETNLPVPPTTCAGVDLSASIDDQRRAVQALLHSSERSVAIWERGRLGATQFRQPSPWVERSCTPETERRDLPSMSSMILHRSVGADVGEETVRRLVRSERDVVPGQQALPIDAVEDQPTGVSERATPGSVGGGADVSVSATAFERYAACPARYLYVDVLGLEPSVDFTEKDTIDSKTYGSMFHSVMHQIVCLALNHELDLTHGWPAEVVDAVPALLDD